MRLTYNVKNILKDAFITVLLLILCYFYFKFPFYNYIDVWWSFWGWLLGLVIIVKAFELFATNLANRLRGISGEDEVLEELDYLPEDFKIFPNLLIENDRGNIDQVVVGPTGVWVIETKSHDGKIAYNGRELTRDGRLFEKDFLKQVWGETFAVKNLIKDKLHIEPKILPIIAFSGNVKINFGMRQIKGVYVIGKKWLFTLISKQNDVLSIISIDQISKLLEQYTESRQLEKTK
jgi:hypothetical protein